MGVKVYHNGNWVEFSTGSNASASFLVQDEGNDLVGLATALNFKGSGVTASNTTGNPSTKEIEITGVTTFLALSDTPTSYVGTAGSVVTVNSSENGLVFLEADSTGLGRDNYINSASFGSLPGGGARLTLGYAGPDSFSNLTADLSIGTLAIGFTQLSDTPANYTGVGNSFVRVKSTEDGLEFINKVPGTAVGAAGADKQVQFNDGGSTLAGADSLEFVKSGTSSYGLYLKPFSTDSDNYGGGRISAETKNNTSTSAPWNRASITADGALELFRTRIVDPVGGPHIDFKSQMGDGNPTGTDQEEDMDARIQMDYANGWVSGQAINPSSEDYSSITFQTGGRGYYDSNNTNGRVTEKIRIGKDGEIGIQAGRDLYVGETANPPVIANNRTAAQMFGNPGQVLTSNGKGSSVYWSDKNQNASSTFGTALLVDITNPSPAPPATLNSTVNLAEFRSAAPNSIELLIYNQRVKYPAGSGGNTTTGWEGVATRIGRQIDVTNHAHIQFGANDGSGEQNIHLHTNKLGDIQFQDAKRILLHANKVDFAKLGSVSDVNFTEYSGMTLVASSPNLTSTSGTIDTGINVSQSWAGGMGLLLFSTHNSWGLNFCRTILYNVRFAVAASGAYNGVTPSLSTIHTSNGSNSNSATLTLGKTAQNTLTITANLNSGHGGRWHLLMGGGNCVDAFTVDV